MALREVHQAMELCRRLVGSAAFRAQAEGFARRNCEIFDEGEENKLEYTPLHQEYLAILDSELTGAMRDELGPTFVMEAFLMAIPAYAASAASGAIKASTANEDENIAPLARTLEKLEHLASFDAFKAAMLRAKREKLEADERMRTGAKLYFSIAQPR